MRQVPCSYTPRCIFQHEFPHTWLMKAPAQAKFKDDTTNTQYFPHKFVGILQCWYTPTSGPWVFFTRSDWLVSVAPYEFSAIFATQDLRITQRYRNHQKHLRNLELIINNILLQKFWLQSCFVSLHGRVLFLRPRETITTRQSRSTVRIGNLE